MHWPSRRAERYSASASSYRHSPAPPLPMCGRASCIFLQRGRSTDRRRELTTVLRPRLRKVAGGKAVKHFAEAFLGQILIRILPDQHHRRVHAGAKTLDFFPAEIAILGQRKGMVMVAPLAPLDNSPAPRNRAGGVAQAWACAFLPTGCNW